MIDLAGRAGKSFGFDLGMIRTDHCRRRPRRSTA